MITFGAAASLKSWVEVKGPTRTESERLKITLRNRKSNQYGSIRDYLPIFKKILKLYDTYKYFSKSMIYLEP